MNEAIESANWNYAQKYERRYQAATTLIKQRHKQRSSIKNAPILSSSVAQINNNVMNHADKERMTNFGISTHFTSNAELR